MQHFVFRWFITTFAVFVAAPIVGINYGDRIGCLLAASLLLGIINAFIRPILLLLSLPLILVTLGLFILIINALMLKFVGEILPCFEVPGFWRAFFGRDHNFHRELVTQCIFSWKRRTRPCAHASYPDQARPGPC